VKSAEKTRKRKKPRYFLAAADQAALVALLLQTLPERPPLPHPHLRLP